jgi:UDP-N-acetylmuramoyl-tripeptide--D-alanyl-D-alanine ligase
MSEMKIEELYQIYLKYPSVQTDTRKLQMGDVYFALKGDTFNGNTFAQEALNQGAAYCVVDEDLSFKDGRLIKVDDVLSTLQQLAKYHRQQFQIPFLAITGSNGKTTTKELIHAVLSTTLKTYTTEGNLNNHIGIPLTLLKIKSDAEIAVVEMGANHQKEIASYCEYTLPTHALINNCGKAHLEGFGGVEGVRKGKGELYDFIRLSGGIIFRNNDYDYLKSMSTCIDKVISYSSVEDADVVGKISDDATMLTVAISKGAAIRQIKTQLVGGYNLPNVLAAVCVGKTFGVSDENIVAALEAYVPSNSRSQLIQKDTTSIVLDAYNANPSSMKVAVDNFAAMQGDNKILMLGGMMELGDETEYEHSQLVELIQGYGWKAVVLVGQGFKPFAHQYQYFDNSIEAAQWFKSQDLHNCQVLIKGSRSMKMERIID